MTFLIDGEAKTLVLASMTVIRSPGGRLLKFSHFQFNELDDKKRPVRAHNFRRVPPIGKELRTNSHTYKRLE